MFFKFIKDNNVFFEFHPDVCYVKDQETQATLLKGNAVNGLYAFPNEAIGLLKPSSSSTTLTAQREFASTTTRTTSSTPTVNTYALVSSVGISDE